MRSGIMLASQYLLIEVGFPITKGGEKIFPSWSQYLLIEVGFPIIVQLEITVQRASQYLLIEVGFPMKKFITKTSKGVAIPSD